VQMYMWTNWSNKLRRHVLSYEQADIDARWATRHKWGGKRVFHMITKVGC